MMEGCTYTITSQRTLLSWPPTNGKGTARQPQRARHDKTRQDSTCLVLCCVALFCTRMSIPLKRWDSSKACSWRAKQDKTRQDKTRQDKTRQARWDKQDRTSTNGGGEGGTNGYKRAETATEGETATFRMTKNDVRTTELEMWIWFVNVYVEKNVFEPIICIVPIGVNIMKHKLYNDKYDVSLIKINVYIGMILANKLIHIKNQCKQLDNRSGHLYVSICLTTQTCATCMSTIRYVAHPSQMNMWTCISNKPWNIDIRKNNLYIKNSNANVKTEYVRVNWTQFAFKH